MPQAARRPADTETAAAGVDEPEKYRIYVLGVLVVVYVFNFLDRQILSILAERIKADLNLSDAQIGFLYGTAFAVFYALFGIPLGRLADVWDRRRLISIGLAVWSAMTASSALARNFLQLSLARIGVGVGEASANPAAYSLLCDYFPAQRRATVRGRQDGGVETMPTAARPLRELMTELNAVIPPFTLFHPALRRSPQQLAINLIAFFLLWRASRHIEHDEATRAHRSRR